jgi:hypothetical protein
MESVNFQGIIVLRLNEDLWDGRDVAVAIQRSNGGITDDSKTRIPPPTTKATTRMTTLAMMVVPTTILTNSNL